MSSSLNATLDRLYGNPGAFISRLRSRMQLYGISQASIAKLSGYSPVEVCRWLNKRRTPSLATMLKLDEALETARNDKGTVDAASIT